VHVFVCLGGKTCPGQGAEAIWTALKAGVADRGLDDRIRVNKAGCMSQCGHGPMICVYPEGVWYCGVTPADVGPILAHLAGGPPHAPRIYVPAHPGANKVEPRADGGQRTAESVP
jgi:(2Fe-2S) ferredoxin